MLKIKENVDLKELEKFGFFTDALTTTYGRPIYEDIFEQTKKREYLLALNKNRLIIKVKIAGILTYKEEFIMGWQIITNKVNKYCADLIQAGLVEKVSD